MGYSKFLFLSEGRGTLPSLYSGPSLGPIMFWFILFNLFLYSFPLTFSVFLDLSSSKAYLPIYAHIGMRLMMRFYGSSNTYFSYGLDYVTITPLLDSMLGIHTILIHGWFS